MDQWFVAYTKSRGEKKLALELEQKGLEAFCPTRMVNRKWSDRVKKVEVPLFSSYCFFKADQYSLAKVYQTRNFSRLVNWLGKPAVIREEEIEQIKAFISQYESKLEIGSGDKIHIQSGAMEGVEGIVQKKDERYLYLCIEKLNYFLRVDTENVLLQKVSG